MKKYLSIAGIFVCSLYWGLFSFAADSDGDLIDDAWESANGLSSSDINDALLDTDSDGQIARDEFNAKTDPDDGGSLLEVTSVSVSDAGTVSLTWSSDTQAPYTAPSYDVLSIDQELIAGGVWSTLKTAVADGGTTTTTTDDVSGMSSSLRLYRPVINGQNLSGTINLGAVSKFSLAEGKSYIGIPFDPPSSTLVGLLGLSQLPSGSTLVTATTVDIWDQTTQTLSDRYWLSDTGSWLETNAVTVADNVSIDLSKGIIITVRSGEGAQDLYVAGTVPRIADSQTIKGSGYTLASLQYPTGLDIADSGLIEGGFSGHASFAFLSDWVMLFNSANGLFDRKFWYDTTTPAWRYVDGLEEADLQLEPGVPFLIRRYASGDFTWTNALPATPTVTVTAYEPVASEQEGESGCFRVSRTGSLEPLTIDFSVSGSTNVLLPSATNTVDYHLFDGTFSNAVSGKLHIPFGVAHADVMVTPINDATEEAAEAITFSFDAPSGYKVGSATQAVVKVADRSNHASNQVVYIAYLKPVEGVDSEAYGLATIRLRGDNDIAILNVSFNGLTSPQSDIHIHRVDNDAIIEDLPLGQIGNYHWEMSPIGISYATELDVINALKANGLYVNVHSDVYPSGEIEGVFNESIGSTELQVPENPPAFTNISADLMEMDIARFLNQATFGATTSSIAEVQSYITTYGGGTNRIAGMSKWLDDQMDTNVVAQTSATPLTKATDTLKGGREVNGYGFEEYYCIMTMQHYASDQLRHRVATALSEIFVVSTLNGGYDHRDNPGMALYYDLLADNAFGDYTNILYNISVAPQMGRYLSHIRNGKETTNAMGEVVTSPDENYAREIMQLFTLGLVKKHLDGSIHIGEDGLPLETYTQDTIFEVAKIFTGWGFSKYEDGNGGDGVQDNSNFFLGDGSPAHAPRFWHPMKQFPDYHDQTLKTTLDGQTIAAGQSGEKDLMDFVTILGNHPTLAPNISRKLIQRLVTSSPSAGYIYRVSTAWVNSNGNLKEVVKAILLDHEARSMTPERDAHVSFGKMKEPMIAYVQMLRVFEGTCNIPLSMLLSYDFPASEFAKYPADAAFLRYLTGVGQKIIDAPSVFNYFLPEFTPPGSLSVAGITAPEFQLLTPDQLYDHINEHYYSVYTTRDGQRFIGFYDPPHNYVNEDDDLVLNFQPMIDLYDAEASDVLGATAVVDHLDLLMNGGRMKRLYDGEATPNPYSVLIDIGADIEAASGTTEDKVKAIVYVLLNSPDFAIQR